MPVNYFMVLAQCREVSWENQLEMYYLLFQGAVSTCRDFAQSDKHLHGDIGQRAVLHTQTRQLDYHPHARDYFTIS